MKRLLLKISLFFLLLLIPLVLIFKMPYDEEFAYHFIEGDCYNHGAWIFDRIKRNSTPIDIAFIGSSHTIHAFQEKKMEELLASNDHIANFGYCRSGRNMEYVLSKLLLSYKTPRLIIIEVNEDEAKNSHDIFPYTATTADLLLTPTLINRDYFSDIYNGAMARLEYFKATYLFKRKTSEPTSELYGYGNEDRQATKEEFDQNISAWKKKLGRNEIETIEAVQLKYPFSYLSKMIRMIKDKYISVAFVYLPESGSKLKIPKYAQYYQKMGTLFIPPSFITGNPENWMDATHLNDKGSGLLSEWMTNQLKSELCITGTNK